MNANHFATDIHIDEAGHYDHLIIRGADTDGEDITLEVAPSEDRAPYDDALRAAGFEPVGDNQARRA